MPWRIWKNSTCWILYDWQKMKTILILIPVYNDWASLVKLINEINKNIKDYKNINFKLIVINDSSTVNQPKLIKPNNINSFDVLNMKENRGHARCNAFGIRYVFKNEKFDNLILMDGDGEDRPVEIKSLVDKIISNPNNSVVAKRVKRSEGILFKTLYQIHKLITLIFTGQKINFGNFTFLTQKDIMIINEKLTLWKS